MAEKAKKQPTRKGGKAVVRLERLSPEEIRPQIQISVYDDTGECIETAPVADDGSYSIPAGARKRAAVYELGAANAEDAPAESSYKIRAAEFNELEKKGFNDIARGIWEGWLPFLRCTTGSVRRCRPGQWWWDDLARFSASPTLALGREPRRGDLSAAAALGNRALTAEVHMSPAHSLSELIAWPFICSPVCDARVEVYRRTCCCQPWVIDDPRLPELIDWLDDLIIDPDDFPRPPLPEPGPDPVPFLDDRFVREGGLDLARVHAASHAEALRAMPRELVAEYINARPYLLCFGTYQCSSSVKVGEGAVGPEGDFNICWSDYRRRLAPGCKDRYSYVVKQRFGPFWLTIYDGRASNQWFDLDDDPTLTTYHSWVRTCRKNPSGAFVYLNYIGSTGAWNLHTPDADSATSVGAPAANSGLVTTGSAASGAANRNWGRTLAVNLMISEGMKALGARYYRLSVTAADGDGDPTGDREDVDRGVVWKKAVPDGLGGVDVVPITLGPFEVGGRAGLYTIPYDSDGDWDDGQFHAFLDTADVRWSDPNVRHLVTVEIFDAAGERLRPDGTPASGLPGPEKTAAFTFRRRYQDLGPTAEVPFGALTHMFWWDNREVFAQICDLRKNGLVFDDECLFLTGNKNSTFGIGYRAFHPNVLFQRYHDVWWKRGLGATAGNVGYLEDDNPNNVGYLTPDCEPSATNKFRDMLRTDLDPHRKKCAFTVFLKVWNKRTNGSDLSFHFDADSAAFVIEV